MKLPYEFIETEPHEKGFAYYYRTQIVPLADKHYRTFRNKWYQNIFNKLLAIVSGITLSIFTIKKVYMWGAPKLAGSLGKGLILPPYFMWWLLVYRVNREYFSILKKDVIPLILKFRGDFKYQPRLKIHTDIFAEHRIFTWGIFSDIVTCDDCIKYEDGDVSLTIIERVSWHPHQHDGYIYFLFQYPFNFPGEALIFSNTDHKTHKARLKKALKNRLNQPLKPYQPLIPKSFHKFDFNEHYQIYSSNTLIDKLFCEELISYFIEMQKIFGEDGAIISVKNNSLLIEIPSKINFFEVAKNYDTPVLNHLEIKRLLKELHLAIETVDIINLIIKRNSENIKHAAE